VIDVDAPCPDGGSIPGSVSFDRIALSNGHFSASSDDQTMQIDGQISGTTIGGTVRYVNGDCDSGAVSFTARKV
jgi:hypothetical protein